MRTLPVLVAVYLLMQWAGAVELLSGVTKPVVVGVLRLVGTEAVDAGQVLLLGRLRVPWTGDCAGLNILAMLLMVSLWAHREAPFSRRHLVVLALALPVAFLANLARIFTLIGYRAVFYPAVEGAALHYLIGFLWVLPVIPLLVVKRGGLRAVEVMQVAAVLALLAPMMGSPGGALAGACGLVALAGARWSEGAVTWQGLAWIAAAVMVAVMRMESLWLPWLLACPFFGVWRWDGRSVLRAALGLGMVTPLTLHLAAAVPAWGAVVVGVVVLVRGPRQAGEVTTATVGRGARVVLQGLAVGWFLFPFVAAAVSRGEERRPPPAGVMSRVLEPGAHELALPGVRPGLEVVWYEPQGDGRHHTLEVCLRFRGVTLRPSGVPGVMTDGQHWYREFFIQDGRRVDDYGSYLWRTFWPLSDPGVHIIVSALSEEVAAEKFGDEVRGIAERLGDLAAGSGGLARSK